MNNSNDPLNYLSLVLAYVLFVISFAVKIKNKPEFCIVPIAVWICCCVGALCVLWVAMPAVDDDDFNGAAGGAF